MPTDGRSIPHEALESMRYAAVKLHREGVAIETLSRSFGVTRSAIYNWIERSREGGIRSLRATKCTGRPSVIDQQATSAARPLNVPYVSTGSRSYSTDQGAQFTAKSFLDILIGQGIQVSMDGRGRALDNVFIERLWRTVKYEEVYIRDYGSGSEAFQNLMRYFKFYNTKRPHSSLEGATPFEVYFVV